MKTRILKKTFLALVLVAVLAAGPSRSFATDMPTAAGSPIAGISFDDRPLILPVQRNFQMAMLTASSELGRSCGRMEAYGWRMANEEQERANSIFNNTVDRMRAQGYSVESKATNAVSRDVTLFTADRTDRHLIFMWSAGEIGLVMVLCETSAPLSPIPLNSSREAEPAQVANMPSNMPMAKTIRSSGQPQAKPAQRLSATGKPLYAGFSPTGTWVGNYTCSQGTTGATLKIDRVKGDQFEGTFSFYPTVKNPYVPKGKYAVFGEYDADSQRILVNPGKWLDRPADFYSTIMIGSFDPVAKTFSGYFQGITGCTSFEAVSESASEKSALSVHDEVPMATDKAEKKAQKKPVIKKKKVVAKPKAELIKDAPVEISSPTIHSQTATPKETPKAPVVKKKEAKAPAKGAIEPELLEPAPRNSSIDPPAGIVIGAPFAVK